LPKGPSEWAQECATASGNNNKASESSSSICYAPFIATNRGQAARLVALGGITSADTVCDLGCGEAGMLIDLMELSGCSAMGCDVDATALAVGQQRIMAAGIQNRITLSQGLIADYDFTRATCVFLFLVPQQLDLMFPMLQLYLDADPCHRIISQRFAVPNLRAAMEEIADVEGAIDSTCQYFGTGLGKAFLYLPARADPLLV
jgi:hypothetical protein